jgi:hypothetical protein
VPASEIREANYDLSLGRWHDVKLDWPTFLDDFQRHWPTDEDICVDFVRDGTVGNGAARLGNPRWRRLTEERAGSAKSVVHFDVQGSVAKSTHAGIPWLRFVHQRLGTRMHFWPFDGWDIPTRCSAIAEVYPALWSHSFARECRDPDQHDAYSAAAWMRRADLDGSLAAGRRAYVFRIASDSCRKRAVPALTFSARSRPPPDPCPLAGVAKADSRMLVCENSPALALFTRAIMEW